MSHVKRDMTQEQREIFAYRPFGLVITAPAGCGKTEVLAYRAKGLLERYDFTGNGRKLLIVTFTNQARDNINERLNQYISVQTLRRRVVVCNFHGLAARIIKAHNNVIGLEGWTVADFDWVGKYVRSLKCDKKTKDQVNFVLRKIKLESLTDDEVMTKIQSVSEPVGKYVKSIEVARIKDKIITYDDQIRTALWILQSERVSQLYRNHFFSALVDEFQDLTHQQLQLVQALCGGNVTYAGDLAQGIYSFAGADAGFTFREITGKGTKQIKLLKSFRSAPAVLNAVNSLSPLTGSEKLVAAFPEHWGDGGLFAFVPFKGEKTESEWVSQTCESILRRCPTHRVGIITRTAFRAQSIKQTFESRGIEYIDWGDGLFGAKTVGVLQGVCDSLPDELPTKMSDCWSLIKQNAIAIQGAPSEELEDACGWLFNQLMQHGRSQLPDIKKRLNRQKGKTIVTNGGIHCLTGHAGKGQQFDWVFILGLEQGTLPFYKAISPEEVQEEARVLSVMISRAKIGVITTFASVDSFGHVRNVSEFLQYLQTVSGFLCGKSRLIHGVLKRIG